MLLLQMRNLRHGALNCLPKIRSRAGFQPRRSDYIPSCPVRFDYPLLEARTLILLLFASSPLFTPEGGKSSTVNYEFYHVKTLLNTFSGPGPRSGPGEQFYFSKEYDLPFSSMLQTKVEGLGSSYRSRVCPGVTCRYAVPGMTWQLTNRSGPQKLRGSLLCHGCWIIGPGRRWGQ